MVYGRNTIIESKRKGWLRRRYASAGHSGDGRSTSSVKQAATTTNCGELSQEGEQIGLGQLHSIL